jgi:hypothetical protein
VVAGWQDYDGLAEAVGRKIAEDTLQEYREAFSVFDQDGDGTISTSELGTVMKTLGQEMSEEELRQTIARTDVDGDGEVDFNEFLALLTERLQGHGADKLAEARLAAWAMRSYKTRASDGADSSGWMCIKELQEQVVEGQVTDATLIFTDGFDKYVRLDEATATSADLEAAMSRDYLEGMMYLNEEQEQSPELSSAEMCALVRAGELRDEMVRRPLRPFRRPF